MSHAVFQAAQSLPMNTQIPKNNYILTKPTILPMVTSYPVAPKLRKLFFIRDSLSPAVDGDSLICHLERCFITSPESSAISSPSMSAPSMKGQYGAFGAVTLEKSKLDMTQKQTYSSPERKRRKDGRTEKKKERRAEEREVERRREEREAERRREERKAERGREERSLDSRREESQAERRREERRVERRREERRAERRREERRAYLMNRAAVLMKMMKTADDEDELATGGGGGDIGKRINNGGGDGGDDGGDDDDYFDDFEDGDEGDGGGLFRRRIVFQELFDRKFLEAVLNEWQKTIMDLPAGFRQAFEMGLVSSAQMVKFLAINARPNSVRTVARGLPQGLSRAFIGRMIADPAFLYRLLLEQATTIGCSAWWEFKNRKDRIKQEWDLALVNVLTAAACNAVVVWSLAPCRSYGNTFRFDLQNTLQKLPNNVFEMSYPLREFDLQKRVHSFFYKAAQLCFVGLTAGAVQGTMSSLCAKKKDDRLSVTMPSVRTNALGTGAFLGLYANLRYQLLCGIDRGLSSYFDVIAVSLFFSTAMRIMNVQVGETSRLAWLGIEADPLVQSDSLMKVHNRAPEANGSNQGSSWLISKNTIISGLGFLGLPQGANGDSADDAPKPRRKRVVRKKVSTA